MKSFGLAFLLFLTAWEYSEALTCYNCYTLYSATKYHGRASKGEVSVPCADNITESNTYVCPDQDSVCTIMHIKLGPQNEILRTCGQTDVCNNGIPGGVEVISCDTCNTDFCNGDNGEDPEPPPNNTTCPTLSFDINLNINLNVYQENNPVVVV